MARRLNDTEQKLNEIFAQNAPELPKRGKRFIVQWLPIISLVVGALSLLAAISLLNWAHSVNGMVDHMNTLCQAYGTTPHCGSTSASRFSFWLWLGLLALLAEAALYVLAYSGLRDRKKQGWDYLFYGALLSVAYAVVILFSAYGSFGGFIGSLIGSAIGFYFLFQVRESYNGVTEPKRVERVEPSEPVEHVEPAEPVEPIVPPAPLEAKPVATKKAPRKSTAASKTKKVTKKAKKKS